MTPRRKSTDEETILYALVGALGLIPVVLVLARGENFGAEPTIGLLMISFAGVGFGELWRVARHRRSR